MNNYQHDTLEAIKANNPEYVEQKASENNIKEENALGVLAFVTADKENYQKMTDKQRYVFEQTILPLIESVECEGMIEGNCQGTGYIPEEELKDAYNSGEFECSVCSGTRENWFANNP